MGNHSDLVGTVTFVKRISRQNITLENMLAQDLTKIAVMFSNIPWPCNCVATRNNHTLSELTKQQDMDMALDKLESYGLAMEAERFVEFENMFAIKNNNSGNSYGNGHSNANGNGKGRRRNRAGAGVIEGPKLTAEQLKIRSLEADRIALSLWEEEEREESSKWGRGGNENGKGNGYNKGNGKKKGGK